MDLLIEAMQATAAQERVIDRKLRDQLHMFELSEDMNFDGCVVCGEGILHYLHSGFAA